MDLISMVGLLQKLIREILKQLKNFISKIDMIRFFLFLTLNVLMNAMINVVAGIQEYRKECKWHKERNLSL